MAHMDRITISMAMGDMYVMHEIRFQARTRPPDLVLPPRETPRRYMRQWLKKKLSELLYARARLKCLCLSIPEHI